MSRFPGVSLVERCKQEDRDSTSARPSLTQRANSAPPQIQTGTDLEEKQHRKPQEETSDTERYKLSFEEKFGAARRIVGDFQSVLRVENNQDQLYK